MLPYQHKPSVVLKKAAMQGYQYEEESDDGLRGGVRYIPVLQ